MPRRYNEFKSFIRCLIVIQLSLISPPVVALPAFLVNIRVNSSTGIQKLQMTLNDDNNNKFGMQQRIDSGKSLVLGAIVGSLASAPVSFVHDVLLEADASLAQWEFDTDAAALTGGLFAIVYRYCIRQDENPQLQQGVIGAFAILRTLSRLRIPGYCTAIPLNCGEPLGIFDWDVLSQLAVNGLESALLFGFAALAIDIALEKGYISRFPG